MAGKKESVKSPVRRHVTSGRGMAATLGAPKLAAVDVPAKGSVQLDDGSHASVYVSNQGRGICVIEPSGQQLRPLDSTVVQVTADVAVNVLSYEGTTVLFLASGSASGGFGLVIDGGHA